MLCLNRKNRLIKQVEITSGTATSSLAHPREVFREAIRHGAGYTKFTTDTSRLFILEPDPRHPAAWSDSVDARVPACI